MLFRSGIPAALVAAGFLALVHWLEERLWTDLPDGLGYSSPPWFLVIGLPVVGAAIVVLARRLLSGDGGHSPLLGISTAGVGTIPAAVFAAAAAWLVSATVDRRREVTAAAAGPPRS